ncbi:MAG TPA: Gfo/Idh/MocA family oxidoreductase, partial [Verrucomicrobiae bacterium]|nr:Gfo/Idh/MocA family oxidoreductase [Verrucomicrobiae bacterium]
MKKYKVGVIGYGWVATAHIAAINSSAQAEVTAVYSSRQLDEAELSKRHGSAITCYTDLTALLATDVDIVSICSYPYDHARQAVAAARAGKHLIIEKPLALNLKDLRRVEKAVAEAGVKSCVCFECRYSSQFLTTRAVI